MKGKKAGSSGRSADLTMAERTGVEQIVEKVVSQVLEQPRPAVAGGIGAPGSGGASAGNGCGGGGASGEGGSANLLKAISAIQSGTTQREILRALLDNTVRYSGRGALFVVKAGAATGWQGRGFTKDGDDTIKDFALNVTTGRAGAGLAVAHAVQRRDPRYRSGICGASSERRPMTRCWCCRCC